MKAPLKIIITILICLGVGFASGFATQSSVSDWYPTLQKPFFNPPSWLFGPVWTVLYIMMGWAAGLVWSQNIDREIKKKALLLFTLQLLLNAAWSFLFFGLRNPFLALVEIVLLWLLIRETYLSFKPIHPLAAKLLLPYWAWVSFATLLNAAIWWLNKG
ncbi:MAG: TspO/MBR family protein [Flavobacterium sp.]|jgi:translocator protein